VQLLKYRYVNTANGIVNITDVNLIA